MCDDLICVNFGHTCSILWTYFVPISRHFSNIRETGCVSFAHMCRRGTWHWLACLSVADLSAADSPRFGITSPGTALQASARHWSPVLRHCKLGLGIAQSSALPPGCLGLSCALWSVNGHMPVYVVARWSGDSLIYIFQGFQLSLASTNQGKHHLIDGWYVKAVTSNQLHVMTCEHSLWSVYNGCQ